jgi:uncharacterized protein (TIGR02391 family)
MVAGPLKTAIPDAETFIALEPEELGTRLLFILRDHGGDKFTIHILLGALVQMGAPPIYPAQYEFQIRAAIFEAWNWLETQGHLVWPDESNGPNGWRKLSRRARRFANATELADYTASLRLPKTMLHAAIADRVWLSFIRAEYDTAVFQAMREVEIAVRAACGFSDDVVGVKLMRRAFGPTGPLRDPNAEEGEAVALADAFAGAIGAFKNPQSHRAVNLDEAAEAAEIVMLASLLLRIVDRRTGARLLSK